MTNKATIDIQLKAVDDDARIVEGWATRNEEDRVGDVVVPRGAIYSLPLPFLLDHDHTQNVGQVDSVEVSAKGIKFRAHIAKIAVPGAVKEMCDSAWELIKNGLRRSVSIGFRALDAEQIPNSYGLLIKKWEWLELSAVTVPALASAAITSFKSVDNIRISTPSSDGSVKLIRPNSLVSGIRLTK